MPTLEQKKTYFDRYWQEQPEDRTDPRSHQRAEAVHRLLSHPEGRLLDFGCGRGVIMNYFSRAGYDVTGADISPGAVEIARNSGHNAFVFDIEANELNDKYDVILCLEVLQQLHNPAKAVGRIKKALNPYGELVISVPNEFHLVSRLKLLFGKSHLGHFHHSHIRLFSPKRDRELFKKTGLKIKSRKHISIVPPRWKTLARIFDSLAQVFPSLLAISSIYNMEVV